MLGPLKYVSQINAHIGALLIRDPEQPLEVSYSLIGRLFFRFVFARYLVLDTFLQFHKVRWPSGP